ncbi:MAG: ABC transporter substrate-binding protein [Hyphomicrobiales bacterium]|nr:ABC transporter substrate-binding protein [Hyphomicrobiales bacterium]
MRLTTLVLAVGVAIAGAGPGAAQDLDAVSFGTNWLAQAEHGGFYQAVADGTYKDHGLDVTIVQGGPSAANQALLMADRIQFYMQGNLIGSFSAVEQDIPVVDVAAIFQKDPQVIIAHPDSGVDTFGDLAKLPTIFMGKDLFTTGFPWMKAEFPGFKDEQIKPYTFSPAPFLADKMSAQQGYITSEPYAIETVGGFVPKLFLMADYGFDTPSTMIEVKADYLEANRDVVQRFVDASIIGWYNYLYGDNTAANDLIKQDNPEITDGQIAFSLAKMKDAGLIDSGAAETGGIGCLSMDQVKSFYDKMVAVGVVKPDIDYTKVVDDSFACNNVGAELKGE